MKTRNLRPCTIIPDSLYVERAADRQLRTVIDDMGRPAYILVSRQMGKTNLLINMKRERTNDIVLYLDLSNRFDTARKWFRNVIDSLIDSFPDNFEACEEKVNLQRESSGFEPNVEFDRHLRLLLRTCSQRVVIVLDEIDSLVGCNYSDVVLAQIRSMYFSRANHAEYARLTYVLSGVAEPSDLIRDKNISPFNIGEKIYLEDFNRLEFDAFVEKANLNFATAIADQIFHWTNGNPRITWDICSEIEDRLLSGEDIDASTVDKVVDKLYLRDHDRAPIDHIRTLVEADIQIRNAIVSIRHSKCDALDDKVKSKLYLAGITKPIDGGELKLKNRVIDLALSDRWIEQISNAEKSVFALATEAYAAGNYDQSITYYEEALADPGYSVVVSEIARIELGLAYLWTKQSSKAIAQFSIAKDHAVDPKVIQLTKLHIGTAFISEQDYENSISPLQDAAAGEDLKTAVNAKLNLLVAYLKSGNTTNLSIAKDLADKLITDLQESADGNSDVALATALYHQSTIFDALQNQGETLKCLEKALQFSPTALKPFLLISKIEKSEDLEQNLEALTEFVTLISNNTILLSEISDSILGLSKPTLAKALKYSYDFIGAQGFDDFLSILKPKYFRSSISKFNIIVNLAEETASIDPDLAFLLLVKCAEHYSEPSPSIESKIKLYRNLALYSCDKPDDQWSIGYLRLLGESCPEELISSDDLSASIGIIVQMWNRADPCLSESLGIWKKFEEKSFITDPVQCAALFYVIMATEKDKDSAYEYGDKFLNALSSIDEESSSQLWAPLKKQAEQIKSNYELSKNKVVNRATRRAQNSAQRRKKGGKRGG